MICDRPPIVGFSIISWDGIWRPRREIMLLLARRGWPSLYTNGLMTTWDFRRGGWRTGPLWDSMEKVGNLVIDRPGRFPPYWPERALGRVALQWHARRMRAALNAPGDHDLVALVFDPMFFPYLEALRPKYVVYYIYDAFAEMGGWGTQAASYHKLLMDRANLIVAVTQSLAETVTESNRARTKILANAVRYETFEASRNAPVPDEIARIKRPRIGYVGSITVALDFDLIHDLACMRPDWNFILVGHVQKAGGAGAIDDPEANRLWQALRALPNVHYFPQIHADRVPAYMASMDVNAMWYRVSEFGWWRHAKPLKLYENLAVGKPVVGAGLAGIREYADVVDIPESREQWLGALTRAIEAGGMSTPDARIALARENSWAKRVEMLDAWIVEMIAGQNGGTMS